VAVGGGQRRGRAWLLLRARPQDGDGDNSAVCDIGAYEREVESVTTHYSTLGDDRPPSLLDQDIFAFSSTIRETVTTTLEEISSSHNTG
jgi:hypothetical protein